MSPRPAWKRRASSSTAPARVLSALAICASVLAPAGAAFGTATAGAHPADSACASGSASLNGVSATSATDAWAVGNCVLNGSGTLAEHWDGTSWTPVTTPSPGASTNLGRLISVSALSPTDAWAVGYYNDPVKDFLRDTLILAWDGSSWTQVPSPDPGGRREGDQSTLLSVSADSPTDAWAVGSSNNQKAIKSILLHWDGTSWTQVPSPNPGGKLGSTFYSAVSADSPTDAWAVGEYTDPNTGNDIPYTLHWDGTQWSHVRSPNPPFSFLTELSSVSALSPSFALTVGIYQDHNAEQHVYTQGWDGQRWRYVYNPHPGGSNGSTSTGVSADSPTDAWAVGDYSSTYTTLSNFTLHWDGTGWTRVHCPSPGGRSTGSLSVAAAVSSLSPTDAWVVGSYVNNRQSTPETGFIMHWDGTTWTQIGGAIT